MSFLKGQTLEWQYDGEGVGWGLRGTAWLLERGTLGYLTFEVGESPSGTGERWRSISSGGVTSSGSLLSKEVSEPPEHLYDRGGWLDLAGGQGGGSGRRLAATIISDVGERLSLLV
jgi:hypothetical protein